MWFPNSYFEDEIRDGFYVPAMMKRAWAAQLEVLHDIDKVCRKHNIQYFADWGTLLGAVRHGGFVPWDDDLDICMKRGDYRKFLEVAPMELPKEYGLVNFHTPYNGEYMWEFLSRIVNQKDICFEEKHMEKFHGFPYVVGIDIFPLDFMAPTVEEEQLRTGLVNFVAYVIDLAENESADGNELEGLLCQAEELCQISIDRSGNIRQQLYILEERLFAMYREEESRIITMMPKGLEETNRQYPKSYYQDTVTLPFENTEIPVPLCYDALLKRKYGDYLQLNHKGGSHDYPFYKRQESILSGRPGRKTLSYKIPVNI